MSGSVKKTVSIIDVAKLAGVSQQTVSRVANGSDLVKEATRRKVRAAMKELGYTPNLQARALRVGRSKMIGMVVKFYRNNDLADVLEGVSKQVSKLGYGIMMIPVDNDASETLSGNARYILSLNLDGMIVFSDDDISDESAEGLSHIPTVVMGALTRFPAWWSYVDMLEGRISELVVDHLLSLGHRTVCHIAGPLSFPASARRVEAWRAALERHGAPVPQYVESEDWTPDEGYRAAVRLLGMYPDCTAVFASDDAIASGAMKACRERGLEISRDVSIVGVDDVLGYFVPDNVLTSVHRDFVAAGSGAVRLLLSMMRDASKRGSRLEVAPELVVRGSTAKYR